MTSVVGINSFGFRIRDELLARLKTLSPFTGCAKFSRTTAKPIREEHLPYLGVYYMGERFHEDGANNLTDPHFKHHLKLGFSYIVANNDPELAEENADAGHWAIMNYLTIPGWQKFPDGVTIEAVTEGDCDHNPGNIGRDNGTPVLEMQMTWSVSYGTRFPPNVTDNLASTRFKAVYPWPEDPARIQVGAEWEIETIPTPIVTTLSYSYSNPATTVIPTDGFITHPQDNLDLMRIAKVGQAAQDNSTFLATLKYGDQITAAGVTWTVQGVLVDTTSVLISVIPMQQSAMTGVQNFTFTQEPTS